MNKIQCKSTNHTIHLYRDNIFTKEDYFEEFINYFLKPFAIELQSRLVTFDNEKLDKETLFYSLLKNYKQKLYHLSGKTLIYEFHQTFTEYDSNDSSKYYNLFAQKLLNPLYIESLLSKYPVLENLISQMTFDFIDFTISIIRKFIENEKDIFNKLLSSKGRLTHIHMNAGDVHKRGKSVAILEIGKSKLVYKPRSLQIDIFYEEFINYINQNYHTNLRTSLSLDYQDYGWQEYIEASPCTHEEQIQNFYYELGMHLAFIYIFQGSDFHYENVIASQDHPVLIDLETLFQGNLDFNSKKNKNHLNINTSKLVNKTVLKSAFFDYASFPEDSGLANIGGLVNMEYYASKKDVLHNSQTDRISILSEDYYMKKQNNLPVLDNKTEECFLFEKEITEGFKKAGFILQHDKVVLEYLDRYKDAHIRIIVRPTYIYATYLEALLHPKYLSNYEERKRVISFIKEAYTRFDSFDVIYPFEEEDMMVGDIPYFYTSISSCQVYSSTDKRLAINILQKTALEDCTKRIHQLSEKELEQQIGLINMAISAMSSNRGKTDRNRVYNSSSIALDKSKSLNDFIHHETIQVLEDSLDIDEQYTQWISIVTTPQGHLSVGPMSFELYNGLAGVALYLLAYQEVYKDNKIQSLLYRTDRALREIYYYSNYKSNYSAFYGSTSYMYYLYKTRDSGLYNEQEIHNHYELYIKELFQNIPNIPTLDFMGGLAGVLKVLILINQVYDSCMLKKVIRKVCTEICQRAIQSKNDLYWAYDADSTKTLAGFSHGITGIVYALSEYYAHIEQDEELLKIMQRALLHEDQYFNDTKKQWKDNRKSDDVYSSPLWCHGSAGIVLGRSKIQENTNQCIKPNWIMESLDDLLENGNKHKQGYSLCHGTLGNLDILITLKEISPFQIRKKEIEKKSEQWLKEFEHDIKLYGWQNGIKNDTSSIGLMLGKTGQLLALLRNQNSILSSVLLLD